jgi:hypothetical protein
MDQMLLEYLFEGDPYAGFPADDYPLNYDSPGFSLPWRLLSHVAEIKPSRIIEVGTWKGNSAFFMADKMTEAGAPFEMVCVDTWLGSREMWVAGERKGRWETLKLKHGYPTLFYQFLSNVIHKGYQKSIIPFPNTSYVAYEVLKQLNYTAQFIYIDANHDYADVYNDITHYWDLVEPGGMLCGDDYGWTGVHRAVTQFAAEKGCDVKVDTSEQSWRGLKCK